MAVITAAGLLWIIAEGSFHLRDPLLAYGPSSALIAYQLVGIGCILLLLGFLGIPGNYTPRPLIYLGRISYGLYVFHYLCRDMAVALLSHWTPSGTGRLYFLLHSVSVLVLGLFFTIVLAALSYRFLERPFLQLKEKFTFIESRAA